MWNHQDKNPVPYLCCIDLDLKSNVLSKINENCVCEPNRLSLLIKNIQIVVLQSKSKPLFFGLNQKCKCAAKGDTKVLTITKYTKC